MLLTIALTHLYVAVKDSVLKKVFSDITRKFWGEWELRLMVIVSLILQVVLVMYGDRRRQYIGKKLPCVAITAWLVYLSADMMASLVLSTLLNGESKLNNGLIVFWTPFLLLHLGSPHNITAYSLEDNDLWLRHFLGMVFLTSEAIYIYLRFQSDTILNFMAAPIFVVGVFKYGERIWALRSASEKQLTNSLRLAEGSFGHSSIIRKGLSKNAIDFQDKSNVCDLKLLRDAYSSFMVFKPLFLGLPFEISKDYLDDMVYLKSRHAEDAFKLVGAELGYVYDLLFTKMPVHHSKTKLSLSLRVSCFLFAVSSLIAFAATVGKSEYPKVDVSVTYLLLVGAICLDAYSFTMHALSTWAMIWLPNLGNNKLLKLYSKAVASRLRSLEPRMAIKSMAQHDLIIYYVEAMRQYQHGNIVRLIDTGNILQKYGHTKWKPVDKELKEFIYSYLKDQKRLNWERMGFKHEDLEKLLNGSCEHISGYHEQELVTVLEYWKWDRTEFTQRIFFWHLATELVYYDDVDKFRRGSLGSSCEIAKSLSDYMMYLVLVRPLMLPKGLGDVINEKYYNQANKYFPEKMRSERDSVRNRKTLTTALLQPTQSHTQTERISDNITDGGYFALMLQNLVTDNHWDHEEKWEMISNVWMEMMIHAASRCSWKEHAQQLRHGGELLTHVALLMAHLGLTTQIRMAEPDHSIDFNMPPPTSP